ncbi:OmpA family protein [uncultured Desulfobacter sp.]|uniref:OmpA family protein n=1 Tax=uncultured Desulfobacter sp. TaxID=240139 RepID=UPI002AAA8686|nr:OmpA family protein [uncultured Desulfobacter sp.]
MIRKYFLFIGMLFLVSCGPKTTVILLPDQDGSTGAVVVKNNTDSIVLNEPYTSTKVSDTKSKMNATTIGKSKVLDSYKILLEAEPLKPVSFLLYFEFGSDRLRPESAALIPKILQVAKERAPSEISIIGHSDTAGDAEYNYKLALDRAQVVEKYLKETGVQLQSISVTSHGEKDPLVVTGDDTYQKKNRRVEIMIR